MYVLYSKKTLVVKESQISTAGSLAKKLRLSKDHLQFNLMCYIFKCNGLVVTNVQCSLNIAENPTAQETICFARNVACAGYTVAIDF